MSADDEAENMNAEDLWPLETISEPFQEQQPTPRIPDPWHKPRKHWIRKEQWGKLANCLLDDLHLDGRPFRYLTLPGRYLLDVRHLHEVCERRDVSLRFLGFDSSRKDDREIMVSMDEVWRLPFIHKDSDLLADRIETLSDRRSMAFKSATGFGDFDAINLDLCDSIASREAGATDSALEAIMRLVEFQTQRRKQPWLLFVTTRADRASIKASVLTKLFDVLRENLERNEQFQKKATEAGFFNESAIAAETNSQATLFDDQFVHAFGISFAKWLLKLSLNNWKVKLEINACYRVANPQNPDMLSLAFRFESVPIRVTDSIGLAPSRKTDHHSPLALTEDQQAVLFVDRFAKLVDVDLLLHESETLREQMIVENAEIMSLARFPRDTIIEWGRSVCWRPC